MPFPFAHFSKRSRPFKFKLNASGAGINSFIYFSCINFSLRSSDHIPEHYASSLLIPALICFILPWWKIHGFLTPKTLCRPLCRGIKTIYQAECAQEEEKPNEQTQDKEGIKMMKSFPTVARHLIILSLLLFLQSNPAFSQGDTVGTAAITAFRSQIRLPQGTEIRLVEKKESPIPGFFSVKLLLIFPDKGCQ